MIAVSYRRDKDTPRFAEGQEVVFGFQLAVGGMRASLAQTRSGLGALRGAGILPARSRLVTAGKMPAALNAVARPAANRQPPTDNRLNPGC